jgi:hypothetical protein
MLGALRDMILGYEPERDRRGGEWDGLRIKLDQQLLAARERFELIATGGGGAPAEGEMERRISIDGARRSPGMIDLTRYPHRDLGWTPPEGASPGTRWVETDARGDVPVSLLVEVYVPGKGTLRAVRRFVLV